ncbi:hypothetical protein DEO72_LG10g1433 [Vigna unguiculata]|uniref:Uncharacterized protein n=1 Tax=Vigna unguiculata TaxID=3917 RepID=A0A4D6N8Y2_VIGUN|nr:hypothetical protein DEO72_LG10g1433 [Vigna unguiculata]
MPTTTVLHAYTPSNNIVVGHYGSTTTTTTRPSSFSHLQETRYQRTISTSTNHRRSALRSTIVNHLCRPPRAMSEPRAISGSFSLVQSAQQP